MERETSRLEGTSRRHADWPFWLALILLGGVYVALIAALLLAQASFTTPGHILEALAHPDIRYAIRLSLLSCSLTTILALWVAVPIGYLMARWDDGPIRRRLGNGIARALNPKLWIDALLDIPIVLPPLVIGLALLILFQAAPARWFESEVMAVTFAVPAVILAQFTVACAFAARILRTTFEQISPRAEQVALTLGCTRAQAFWKVVLPEAKRGLVAAATMAWARSLGEFGPILVFAGATRQRTEVLSTSVFLELSIGNLEAAVAVSMLMIAAAAAVLVLLRLFGSEVGLEKAVRP